MDEQGGHVVIEPISIATTGADDASDDRAADAHRMIAALEGQLSCYRRLARLAEAQHEQVQQGSADALVRLLHQRQDLLDEAGQFNRLVARARREWHAFVACLPPDRREHAEKLVLETRRLLEQITQSDADDMLVLQQRKLNVGRQIGQATASRQVNRAYASTAYGRPANPAAKNTDVLQ